MPQANKRSHWRHLACAAAALLLAGCSLLSLWPREFGVTYADINERLGKHFPFERNIADLVRVTLLRPRVAGAPSGSGQTTGRLVVSVDLDLRLPSLVNATERSLWGSVSVSGVPRFDTGTQSIRLSDARVDRVQVDHIPDALSAALSKTASQIVRQVMEERPIYTLTVEQTRRLGSNVRAIDIELHAERLVFRQK